jgi:hypothetical protein
MTTINDLRDMFSDAYKELHGVRPRGHRLMRSSNPEELSAAIDDLHDQMNEIPGFFDAAEPWEENSKYEKPVEFPNHNKYLTSKEDWEELKAHPKRSSMGRRPTASKPFKVTESQLRNIIRRVISESKR